MAMYQAKSAGRGRFAFFSHELNTLAQEKQELEIALQRAIRNDELELFYQPQIRLKDNTLYGLEALSRWFDPILGDISPGKFIPLAEECGLIGELSEWAIKRACAQLAKWRKNKVLIPKVSINLSPLNFHNMRLCDIILREIENNHLLPQDIVIELTENVLFDNNPKTMEILQAIHSKGIGVSMDDFGTGYSSLSYLRKFPIQELKLDRSFISEIEDDPTSQALSQTVINLGENLTLDVVAEGIEREEQLNILKRQGYHVGQGYLFSKPLNEHNLVHWLAEFERQYR